MPHSSNQLLEADQRLLQVLSELDLSSEPYEAFLFALNIHPV